jgi:hypothetical protein
MSFELKTMSPEMAVYKDLLRDFNDLKSEYNNYIKGDRLYCGVKDGENTYVKRKLFILNNVIQRYERKVRMLEVKELVIGETHES